MWLVLPSWRGEAAITRSYARNVISQLDRCGHQPEGLKAFPSPQKSHVAVIQNAPQDRLIDLHAFDLVEIHFVGPAADETRLVNDPPVRSRDLGRPLNKPLADEKNERNDGKYTSEINQKGRGAVLPLCKHESDQRREHERESRPIHNPMQLRGVADVLTRLQNALNVAHPSSPGGPP